MPSLEGNNDEQEGGASGSDMLDIDSDGQCDGFTRKEALNT